MRVFIRFAAAAALLLPAAACKQQQASELLTDTGEEVPKGPCEANPSSPEDDKVVPSGDNAFTGCTESILTAEVTSVETGATRVNEEIGRMEKTPVDKTVGNEAVMELQGEDERIAALERDLAAMQRRLAALRRERERRQSARPQRTNVCVQVKANKVVGCSIDSSVQSCAGEADGVKKVFFGEGSCAYFRIDSGYTGTTGGACLSITTTDNKISSCSYGTTREGCEGGSGNAGYRYVFREQACESFRSGTVFTGSASTAGGTGNGGSGSQQQGGQQQGSTGSDGGQPAPTAFQERCVREGGFPVAQMCQCDEAGWQLSETAFNSLKAGDCKVTVKGICNIVKGRIEADGGCLCNGSTRYATSAFRIGTVCTQAQSPSPAPQFPTPGPAPQFPTPSPQAPTPSPLPQPGPSTGACPSRVKGTLVVTVPRADSRLRVNGQQTTQTGTSRTFETPPLCIDRQYKYRLAVDDGAPVDAMVQGRGTTRCTLPGRCEAPR